MNKKILKEFHKLPKEEQQEIRKSYRSSHSKDYKYSIRLFCLYCVIGVVGLLGLILHTFYSQLNGLVIYTFAFLLLIICVYLLNKSNEPFYKYLKNKLNKKD